MKLKELLIWVCVLVGAVGVGEVAVQAVVTTTGPRNDYTGTGATTTYSYTFRIFDATDLLVIQTTAAGVSTTLTYPTNYTVTGVNKSAGGTIILTAGALASGNQLTIKFKRTPRQSTDLRNQGSFLPETHESKFDELTRYIQALEEKSARSLKQPDQETGTAASTTLPAVADRASKFLGWDASGNVIASNSVSGTVPDEGNWTPSVGGTSTYSTQVGRYYKIGKLVCLNGTFTINTIGTGSTSAITGIPFVPAVAPAVFTVTRSANLATNVVSLAAYTFASGIQITLYSRTAAAAAESANAVLGDGSFLSFAGCYQAAS